MGRSPRLGTRTAELMEMPIMLVVTIVAARWTVLRQSVPMMWSARLEMGCMALVLMLIAEFGFVLWIRGLSIKEYFASRDPVTALQVGGNYYPYVSFLTPKLPAPKEEDLSKGILETIDMDSYRAEVKSAIRIALPDQDAEIGPVPTDGGGRMPEPQLDLLSNIVKSFNEQFGNIDWKDADKIQKVIAEEIPAKVAADTA